MELKNFSEKTFLRFLFWKFLPGGSTWVISSLGGKLIFSSETDTSLQEGSWIWQLRFWELHSVSYWTSRRNSLSQPCWSASGSMLCSCSNGSNWAHCFWNWEQNEVFPESSWNLKMAVVLSFFSFSLARKGQFAALTFWTVIPRGWDLLVLVPAFLLATPPAL